MLVFAWHDLLYIRYLSSDGPLGHVSMAQYGCLAIFFVSFLRNLDGDRKGMLGAGLFGTSLMTLFYIFDFWPEVDMAILLRNGLGVFVLLGLYIMYHGMFAVVTIPICRRWPRLAKELLLKPDDERDDHGHPKHEASIFTSALVFASAITFMLWYGKIYSPVGTSNPGWTNAFG